MDLFLTAADAGRILNVTPATVRLMHRQGTLEASAETEGGIRLYRRSDVEALAQCREVARHDRTS